MFLDGHICPREVGLEAGVWATAVHLLFCVPSLPSSFLFHSFPLLVSWQKQRVPRQAVNAVPLKAVSCLPPLSLVLLVSSTLIQLAQRGTQRRGRERPKHN